MRWPFVCRKQTMLSKVRKAILEHKLIPRGARLLVAVSGGVDSMVMLHLLHLLAAEFNFELCVGHVNHNMRGEEARLDAESVRAAAANLNLDFRLGEIPPSEWIKGGNRQERARELRFELLRNMACELSACLIATAHNADDQAETFIDRLLRGSGPHGLSGMARHNGDIVRPLLDCTRAEIVEYAQSHGICWREDRSNADHKYRRSRIRHEIMPLLHLFNPQASEAICNAAESIRLQSEAIDQWADREFCSRRRMTGNGRPAFESRGLEFLPEAVITAVFQRYLSEIVPGLRGIGRAQLLAMNRMLEGDKTDMQISLPGGLLLFRDGSEIRTGEKAAELPEEFEICINGEGTYAVPGGTFEVRILSKAGYCMEGAETAFFDLDKLSGHLILRSRKAGDLIALPNLGHCRVSKVLSDRHVPVHERRRTIILADSENILWLAGIRRSAHAYIDDKTDKILQVAYKADSPDIG